MTCVPHFSDKTLKILKGMGIECLPELIERDKTLQRDLQKLGLPSSEAYKEALSACTRQRCGELHRGCGAGS